MNKQVKEHFPPSEDYVWHNVYNHYFALLCPILQMIILAIFFKEQYKRFKRYWFGHYLTMTWIYLATGFLDLFHYYNGALACDYKENFDCSNTEIDHAVLSF